MTDTPLDAVHAAMMAAPENDTARLRFYERMADVELYLLLEAEPEGDQIIPRVLEAGGAQYLLAFDRAERLAQYAGEAGAYVVLSGRDVASMLTGQPLGIALNIDVAPSAILLPDTAVAWLCETLTHAAAEVEAKIESLLTQRACRNRSLKPSTQSLPPPPAWRRTHGWWASSMREEGADICWPSLTRFRAHRTHWCAPPPKR